MVAGDAMPDSKVARATSDFDPEDFGVVAGLKLQLTCSLRILAIFSCKHVLLPDVKLPAHFCCPAVVGVEELKHLS